MQYNLGKIIVGLAWVSSALAAPQKSPQAGKCTPRLLVLNPKYAAVFTLRQVPESWKSVKGTHTAGRKAFALPGPFATENSR
ncbi:hypothetical protein MGG_14622 [Pyricularia oryzae 70-15]|uniref:Uncharacterized protein n=1 Tax=Pyricularia oryzae (strain 70-15 / ATCC MYA-4617 / FGSC 8958) TaxID=242507 RepID=G4MMA3_PYRO7|nr:uncharacterized protein MGG_14622 [Pyricularia oryzae 70-15]EHA56089.1 hypothetical protein MGG_14622 [Pyricularia oryzae 70-15]KAI7910359.1 hypothetical protein M9X92_011156 [Pyricularia oryzae]KAI7910654.1 hypothetical protein M0657_011298 [Pyricularia oryzae]